MDLAHGAANTRSIVPHDHEEVFGNVAYVVVDLHDFDMGKPLTI